jgi:hypothetical protein
MVGGKQLRRSAVAMCVVVAGCVGLGDSPSNDRAASRPRPQPTGEKPAPELRIPANAVAQGPDIPLVPLPPLKQQSAPASGGRQPPVTPSKQGADAPRSPAPQAQTAPPPQTPPHTARQLLKQAAERCAKLDSYIVRLTRREHLKGKANPEEIMMFKFRKKPFSVHFKWLGEAAKGREVIYVKGQYGDKIHTRLATGDAPLMPAGTRLSVAPDSMLARSASRHPITDAGLCHCIESLTSLLDAQERGDRRRGTLTAIAPQRRPEYPQPVETLEWVMPAGVEPNLPRGGRRLLFFDSEWHLPMLVITYDDKGQEVEYYRHDRMQTPVNLDDDDFNPDKLWPAAPSKTTPAADGSRGH